MTVVIGVAIALGLWLLVAIPIALITGQGIAIADAHETPPPGVAEHPTPRRGADSHLPVA